jgi:hypothetical protein
MRSTRGTGLWTMRLAHACLLALCLVRPVVAQEATGPEDVREGRELAISICGNCHVAASDQYYRPILLPPAPPLALLAQRKAWDADSLHTFLTTTHKDEANPKAMPRPELIDKHLRQVIVYFLSLR